MFGHQWSSQQGDAPNDTWIRGCSDLTAAQFVVGLRALLDKGKGWPPSLPEFRELCLGGKNWEYRTHLHVDATVGIEDLTTKAAKLEERKAALAKLRKDCGI